MLELRPTCENCNRTLPPDSLEARICSYECTFCAACVDTVLANVCPNCGGGFAPRPIRPARNWKGDNFLGKTPQVRRAGTGPSIRRPTPDSLPQSRPFRPTGASPGR
jgi:hypothetical protein